MVDASLNPSDIQAVASQGAAIWHDVQGAGAGDLRSMLAIGTLVAQNIPAGDAANAVKAGLSIGESALAGASAGSVIPGYGTVVGAAIGAVLGIVESIMAAQAAPHELDPGWLVAARQIPGPDRPDGTPPTDADKAAAKDLWEWQAARFGHWQDWQDLATQKAFAKTLWDYPADRTRGSVPLAMQSVDGSAVVNAMSLFATWCEPYGPIWLPANEALQSADPAHRTTVDGRYGWDLALGLWSMAVQGNSHLDALHWMMLQQWTLHTQGGPEPHPHLAYMIGRLSMLVTPPGGKSLGEALHDRFAPQNVVMTPHLAAKIAASGYDAGRHPGTLLLASGALGWALLGPWGLLPGALVGYALGRRKTA